MKKAKRKEKKLKKQLIRQAMWQFASILTIFVVLIIVVIWIKIRQNEVLSETTANIVEENNADEQNTENVIKVVVPNKKEITDWNLKLVNKENALSEDYEVELATISNGKQFDKRAIEYLKNMLEQMKAEGINDMWVQSSYRSVTYQKEVYQNSIQKYLNQGYDEQTAIKLTDEYINRPGESEHNLGLAIDFNNVDENFEKTKAYNWLLINAKDYGFILRYPKEKEEITKVKYEPWHWRYVGEEHSKKMDELNMCLEEYIEYLEEI